MTKSDLRTGWRVTLRNGSKVIILKDCSFYERKETDIYLSKDNDSWDSFSYWNDNLTGSEHKEYDVMEVEQPRHPYEIFEKDGIYKTIWTREEIKEITIRQVEEKFGCKVKIIG